MTKPNTPPELHQEGQKITTRAERHIADMTAAEYVKECHRLQAEAKALERALRGKSIERAIGRRKGGA